VKGSQARRFPAGLIGALIFLAAEDSDFITGQTIAVDGGSIKSWKDRRRDYPLPGDCLKPEADNRVLLVGATSPR